MKDLIDLFGQPFKLNYNGKYLFKTSFSAFISALFMISIVLYAFWNIYRMTQYSDLKMNNYQTVMSENDSLYQLNNTNFYLAFLVFSWGGNVFDQDNPRNLSKYFRFESYYSNGSSLKSLEVKRCNSTVDKKISN